MTICSVAAGWLIEGTRGFDASMIAGLACGRNDYLPSVPAMTRKIGVVIFPDFQILDATGPIAAFEIAGRISRGAYSLEVLAAGGGEVASSSGVRLLAQPLDEGAYDTIVIAGGNGTRNLASLAAPVAWLKRRAPGIRRTASVCSGAYLLAEAGL